MPQFKNLINQKAAEYLFLLVVFGLLLWFGLGTLYDHKIVHDMPIGYLASDAYWHLISADWVYSHGNYLHLPFFLAANFTDVVGFQPPILFHLTASFAYFTGVPVYDSMFFLLFFFIISGVILAYLVIRDFNKHVAILSLPLTIFLFSGSFYLGILWGEVNYYMGSFFLLGVIFLVTKDRKLSLYVLLGLLMSGLALGHTSEFIFGVLFLVVYLFILFLQRCLDTRVLRDISFAALICALLSFYYLTVFYFAFGYNAASSISLFSVIKGAGFRVAFLSDFGFIAFAMLAGLLLWFFIKNKLHPAFAFGLFMLFIGLSNYIGLQTRSFQSRYFWPIYLSVFLGLAFYYLVKLFMKPDIRVSGFLSVVLLLVLAHYYFDPLTNQTMMTPYHWDSLNWIRTNTPQDADVLIFYGDTLDQTGQLPLTERKTSFIHPNAYEEIYQSKTIPRYIPTHYLYNADISLAYRKSFFHYGYHTIDDNLTAQMDRDICIYNYYMIDKQSAYSPEIAKLNVAMMNALLEHGNVREVYNNGVTSILKNDRPGQACLNET